MSDSSVKTIVDDRGVVQEHGVGFSVNVPAAINSDLTISGSFDVSGSVDINGALLMTGDPVTLGSGSITWDDIRVPVTSTRRGGARDPVFKKFLDDGASSQGVYAYEFSNPVSAPSEKELFFSVQMPHDYVIGSELRPHVHWTPSTTGAGNVTWLLEYTWSYIHGEFSATTLISSSNPAMGSTTKHQISSLPTISETPVGTPTVSSMLICRLSRVQAGNTYAATCWLHEIDFHYQKDGFGSRNETSK